MADRIPRRLPQIAMIAQHSSERPWQRSPLLTSVCTLRNIARRLINGLSALSYSDRIEIRLESPDRRRSAGFRQIANQSVAMVGQCMLRCTLTGHRQCFPSCTRKLYCPISGTGALIKTLRIKKETHATRTYSVVCFLILRVTS